MSLLLALTAAGGGSDAVFVGTTSLTFSQTGALASNTAPAGTTTLTFAQTGALNAFSSLSGTATAVFGQTGSLSGGSGLNGTTTLAFGQSGDFVAGAAAGDAVFVGTATITFGQSGDFVAYPAIPIDDTDYSGHDGKKRKQQHEYAYDDYAKRKRELEAIIAKAVKTVDPETDTSAEVLEAVDSAPATVLQSISNVVLEYRKLIARLDQFKLDEDVAIAMLLLQ